jgi:hypothetical protein
MTIQDIKTAQTTLHQAINQAYQRGVFSLDDSIEITDALSELANFINAIEQQQKDNEKKVMSISESELIEALEKSPDNPANKK